MSNNLGILYIVEIIPVLLYYKVETIVVLVIPLFIVVVIAFGDMRIEQNIPVHVGIS